MIVRYLKLFRRFIAIILVAAVSANSFAGALPSQGSFSTPTNGSADFHFLNQAMAGRPFWGTFVGSVPAALRWVRWEAAGSPYSVPGTKDFLSPPFWLGRVTSNLCTRIFSRLQIADQEQNRLKENIWQFLKDHKNKWDQWLVRGSALVFIVGAVPFGTFAILHVGLRFPSWAAVINSILFDYLLWDTAFSQQLLKVFHATYLIANPIRRYDLTLPDPQYLGDIRQINSLLEQQHVRLFVPIETSLTRVVEAANGRAWIIASSIEMAKVLANHGHNPTEILEESIPEISGEVGKRNWVLQDALSYIDAIAEKQIDPTVFLRYGVRGAARIAGNDRGLFNELLSAIQAFTEDLHNKQIDPSTALEYGVPPIEALAAESPEVFKPLLASLERLVILLPERGSISDKLYVSDQKMKTVIWVAFHVANKSPDVFNEVLKSLEIFIQKLKEEKLPYHLVVYYGIAPAALAAGPHKDIFNLHLDLIYRLIAALEKHAISPHWVMEYGLARVATLSSGSHRTQVFQRASELAIAIGKQGVNPEHALSDSIPALAQVSGEDSPDLVERLIPSLERFSLHLSNNPEALMAAFRYSVPALAAVAGKRTQVFEELLTALQNVCDALLDKKIDLKPILQFWIPALATVAGANEKQFEALLEFLRSVVLVLEPHQLNRDYILERMLPKIAGFAVGEPELFKTLWNLQQSLLIAAISMPDSVPQGVVERVLGPVDYSPEEKQYLAFEAMTEKMEEAAAAAEECRKPLVGALVYKSSLEMAEALVKRDIPPIQAMQVGIYGGKAIQEAGGPDWVLQGAVDLAAQFEKNKIKSKAALKVGLHTIVQVAGKQRHIFEELIRGFANLLILQSSLEKNSVNSRRLAYTIAFMFLHKGEASHTWMLRLYRSGVLLDVLYIRLVTLKAELAGWVTWEFRGIHWTSYGLAIDAPSEVLGLGLTKPGDSSTKISIETKLKFNIKKNPDRWVFMPGDLLNKRKREDFLFYYPGYFNYERERWQEFPSKRFVFPIGVSYDGSKVYYITRWGEYLSGSWPFEMFAMEWKEAQKSMEPGKDFFKSVDKAFMSPFEVLQMTLIQQIEQQPGTGVGVISDHDFGLNARLGEVNSLWRLNALEDVLRVSQGEATDNAQMTDIYLDHTMWPAVGLPEQENAHFSNTPVRDVFELLMFMETHGMIDSSTSGAAKRLGKLGFSLSILNGIRSGDLEVSVKEKVPTIGEETLQWSEDSGDFPYNHAVTIRAKNTAEQTAPINHAPRSLRSAG